MRVVSSQYQHVDHIFGEETRIEGSIIRKNRAVLGSDKE